jgi:hypothetical protein
MSISSLYSLPPTLSQRRNLFSNGSTNTITNDIKEDMTPILVKKKSHSAPESDTSSSIYDATLTPVPKKKLSLDGTLSNRDSCASTITAEFTKEKSQELQEKDLDEASVGRARTISPAATLTSVSDR